MFLDIIQMCRSFVEEWHIFTLLSKNWCKTRDSLTLKNFRNLRNYSTDKFHHKYIPKNHQNSYFGAKSDYSELVNLITFFEN